MKHRIKSNNRGASLISVIVAMTVVSLLGIVILFVAYSNLNMKVVDRKSKNNFYRAESVLDEIAAGLEIEMSRQYEAAYTTVMARYGSYSSVADMETDFRTEFVLDMVEAIHQQQELDADNNVIAESESLYSLTLLKSYVDFSDYTDAVIAVTVPSGKQAAIETLQDGLVLRNLQVSFTDTNGTYVDKITTDIKITVPTLKFALVSSMPQIDDYAYISNEGIEVSNNITLTLTGNAYAGNENNGSGGTSVAVPESIHIGTDSVFNASAAGTLIADGDVVLHGGAELSTGDNTSLWAHGITAQTSTATNPTANNVLSLLGRTYVGDDTTLSGSGNELTLAGYYFGYGDESEATAPGASATAAAYSSAIIINGRDTTVDMSQMNSLVLAGTAFVSSSKLAGIDATATNTSDIRMGDSVAVKSNQIAYLVPTECQGITSNPMSYNQYKKLSQNGTDTTWIQTALESTIGYLNRSIASYGSVTITPVFSQEQGGSVYLFLDFSDTSVAAQYFMDMYGSTSTVGTKLQSYMDNYLQGFTFNSTIARLVTNGNYLVQVTDDDGNIRPEYKSAENTIGDITNELHNYSRTYSALCTKLVTSSSGITATESANVVYQNLVDETKIAALFAAASLSPANQVNKVAAAGTNGAYVVFSSDLSDLTKAKAIIVNGDFSWTSTMRSTLGNGSGIILATGDVTVYEDWTGVIICGGKLTVAGNASLTADSLAVGTALRLGCDEVDGSGNATASYVVTNFFRGGENYTGATDDAAEVTDVRDCVTYENWQAE